MTYLSYMLCSALRYNNNRPLNVIKWEHYQPEEIEYIIHVIFWYYSLANMATKQLLN